MDSGSSVVKMMNYGKSWVWTWQAADDPWARPLSLLTQHLNCTKNAVFHTAVMLAMHASLYLNADALMCDMIKQTVPGGFVCLCRYVSLVCNNIALLCLGTDKQNFFQVPVT